MASFIAAQQGHSVTLLERNEKLGKKLYITGKGRCNVTNLCTPEAFMQNIPRNPKFLFSALRAFPAASTGGHAANLGLPHRGGAR